MRAPPSNMHVNIRFKATGHSMVLGNFAAGDIARAVPIALARHLVEDAGAAEYLDAPPATTPDVPANVEPALRRASRRAKE